MPWVFRGMQSIWPLGTTEAAASYLRRVRIQASLATSIASSCKHMTKQWTSTTIRRYLRWWHSLCGLSIPIRWWVATQGQSNSGIFRNTNNKRLILQRNSIRRALDLQFPKADKHQILKAKHRAHWSTNLKVASKATYTVCRCRRTSRTSSLATTR